MSGRGGREARDEERGDERESAHETAINAHGPPELRAALTETFNPRERVLPLIEGQVIWYSGPSPPSGGVRRPPLAVIAPHCTQFDGLTIRSTWPFSGASSGIS